MEMCMKVTSRISTHKHTHTHTQSHTHTYTYTQGVLLGGHRTGAAKIKFANGDVYEGDVENGKAYGVGVLMYADGETTFKGLFRMGLRHGKGTIIK